MIIDNREYVDLLSEEDSGGRKREVVQNNFHERVFITDIQEGGP